MPEHHHPVFNFGAFDESVPCCTHCQGCSDQRAPHHRRQSRRKGEVRGVISQSLANDSKLIHQVRDSLRLLVLGVSNLPRQPRGLCKLKIYLPRRGISPAARWAEAGGGLQTGRQQKGLRAEPGGTKAEPDHPSTFSGFFSSTYNTSFSPAHTTHLSHSSPHWFAEPELNILLHSGYLPQLCSFLWGVGANLSPCISPAPGTPAVLRHPPAGTSHQLLTHLRSRVPGGEAAIPLLSPSLLIPSIPASR